MTSSPQSIDSASATAGGGVAGSGLPTSGPRNPGALPTAALVALGVFALYVTTMGRTVPFWDAGEFIATARILGIPHPPGTPLYVLLGRLATLGAAPLEVAARVNGLSALAAAATVFFTVLGTIRLLSSLWSEERDIPRGLSLFGGAVAGLALGLSNEFWTNAIEAEVYALSSLVIAFSIWAVLRWRDLPNRDSELGWLLLVFYVLSLSIGVHLGTYLVLPGLAILVALEWIDDRRVKIAVVVTTIIFPPLGAVIVAVLLAARRPRLLAGMLALALLGVSVHFYLLIRAGVDPPPAINEANPSNWPSLRDVLLRKQYPPTNLLERRAPLWFQYGHMYFRYLYEQFALLKVPLAHALPLALGALGAIVQLARRRRDATMMLAHFFFMCVLLVFYLNLSGRQNPDTGLWEMGEVRERAYFFVPSFQIFAMWIGIGAASMGLELWRLLAGRWGRSLATLGLSAALIIAAIPLGAGLAARHHEHDRRNNFLAYDYAYNILNFVEPNAILFTNGDNDTFPLWYLQEVEGIRRDVRVCCLSLLNTSWYIQQCRDQEPSVPMSFTDTTLESMQVFYEPQKNQLFVMDTSSNQVLGLGQVKDVAVRNIIENNNFERPVYFAITVPDRVGYDEQLSLEGMVYRVLPEPPAEALNVDLAFENARHKYGYRGVLNDDFTRDTSVSLSETGEYLMQNYANIFTHLAFELHARGRLEDTLTMLNGAQAINPTIIQNDLLRGMVLDELGQYDEAITIFEQVRTSGRVLLDTTYRLGLAYYHAGRFDEAAGSMEEARQLAPEGLSEPTLWLARIQLSRGREQEARRLLAEWLRSHPSDERVRRILADLESGEDSLLPR